MGNKKILWIVVAIAVVVLVGGGVTAAILLGGKNNNSNQTSGGTNSTKSNVDPSKEFSPASLDSLSYSMKSTTTTGAGETSTAYEFDGKGNFKATSWFMGKEGIIYSVNGQIYSCPDGEKSCTKVDSSRADDVGGGSPGLDSIKKSLESSKKEYLGKKECPAGTCHVWKVSSFEYYLDSSNRISKVTSEFGSVKTSAEFEYKSITITAPKV